jgi:hypothetical protein
VESRSRCRGGNATSSCTARCGGELDPASLQNADSINKSSYSEEMPELSLKLVCKGMTEGAGVEGWQEHTRGLHMRSYKRDLEQLDNVAVPGQLIT